MRINPKYQPISQINELDDVSFHIIEVGCICSYKIPSAVPSEVVIVRTTSSGPGKGAELVMFTSRRPVISSTV